MYNYICTYLFKYLYQGKNKRQTVYFQPTFLFILILRYVFYLINYERASSICLQYLNGDNNLLYVYIIVIGICISIQIYTYLFKYLFGIIEGDGEVIMIYLLLNASAIIIFNYFPHLLIVLLIINDVFEVYIVTSFIHIGYL